VHIKPEQSKPVREMRRFQGIAVSRGIAIGPAYRYHRTLLYAEDRQLSASEVDDQIARLDTAIKKARTELEKVRKVAEQKVGASAGAIFEAQMMMVSDEIILKTIRERIRTELRPAAFVVDTELSHYQHLLQTGDNPVMRERVADVEDIKQRLLRYLLDREKWLSKIEHPSILVAEFLTPADAILFARANVLGYVNDSGGVTSHVAILARSLGIPALAALHNAAQTIETGDMLILDGERGELIVHPDDTTLRGYEEEVEILARGNDESSPDVFEVDTPVVKTTDAHPVHIFMNLEFGADGALNEVERVSRLGASERSNRSLGLGLIRTEHFLLLHDEFPTEEEQTKLYEELAARFSPAHITFRTFDVGGDKILSESFEEANPFLGWRGIRISLDEPELFLAQLRSILRASVRKNVKLLFPMVTNVDELIRAKEVLERAKDDLRANGEPFDEKLPVGVMIEVPSAAMLAHAFVPHLDFISIGTNDLTQYTLAVDRGNDLIADLFQELHPAVLQLMKMTVDAAHAAGKPVSVCGEMASNPLATPILVGLGVDDISVASANAVSLAQRIKLLSFSETQVLTEEALTKCHTPREVKALVSKFLTERDLNVAFGEALIRRPVGARPVKI
jgi:phosphotransferase system enzyme I (PtsI)